MNSFTSTFRLCLILIAIFITSSAFAQNQVRITLHQPPPNQLSAGNLWKMTLENTTGSPIEIYLEGYGEEEKEGRIVEGRSPVFTLPPGRKGITYDDVKSGNVNWKNSKYEEFIVRTGQVPAGSYTTCVTAYLTEGMILGMEKCITQVISRGFVGEITLITPSDGENVDPSTPITFSWTPLPSGGPYKIKIVEIIGDQSPEVAMQRNKAFYEKEDLRQQTFQYPSSAPKFEEGKKYAWIVIAGDLQSEPGIVKLVASIIDDINIILISPANGEVIGSDSITFKWETGSTGPFKIKIVEIIGDQSPEVAMLRNKSFFEKEDIKRTPSKFPPGSQSFQYPASAPRFVEGKKYAWIIIAGDLQSGVSSFFDVWFEDPNY